MGALRINEQLHDNLELPEKVREAEEWVQKYRNLRQRLATKAQDSAPFQEAKVLLEDGRVEETRKILFTECYNMAEHYRTNVYYDQAITNYEKALR